MAFSNPNDFVGTIQQPSTNKKWAESLKSNAESVWQLPSTRTISNASVLNGVLTMTQAECIVLGEGGAPDDVETISFNTHAGNEISLWCATGKTINIVNSANVGGIKTYSGSNIKLSSTKATRFKLMSGVWVQQVYDYDNIEVTNYVSSELAPKTSAVTFYISKTGSDSNDGLTESTAFLTWNKAFDEACKLRISRNSGIILRFSGDDWGNLDIRTTAFSCGSIRITSITNTIGSDADYSQLPRFSRINVYGGRSTVDNVVSDTIYQYDYGIIIIGTYCRFSKIASIKGRVGLNSGSYSIYKTAPSQDSAFKSDYGGLIESLSSGTTFNFVENCSFTTATSYALNGGHIIFNASYVSFAGSEQTSKNFSCIQYGKISIYSSTDKTYFPGNGSGIINTGGSYCGETAELNAVRAEIIAATIVGKIDLLPFRYNALPSGWYFCNGTRYNTSTAVGAALKSLPTTFKTDWGMTLSGSGATETINVPNWFHTDGRGPTMRAVNGTSRQVGSVEEGAIKEMTGGVNTDSLLGAASGVFSTVPGGDGGFAGVGSPPTFLDFKASREVETANEVRMLNRGMTPAIYLGV